MFQLSVCLLVDRIGWKFSRHTSYVSWEGRREYEEVGKNSSAVEFSGRELCVPLKRHLLRPLVCFMAKINFRPTRMYVTWY